jgi:hypothetical protein
VKKRALLLIGVWYEIVLSKNETTVSKPLPERCQLDDQESSSSKAALLGLVSASASGCRAGIYRFVGELSQDRQFDGLRHDGTDRGSQQQHDIRRSSLSRMTARFGSAPSWNDVKGKRKFKSALATRHTSLKVKCAEREEEKGNKKLMLLVTSQTKWLFWSFEL